MKLFFAVVFLIYSLVNVYIFYKGWQVLPASLIWRIAYSVLFFIAFSSFICAMVWRNDLPVGFLQVLYAIGTVWMGCMLYFTLFFLLTDLTWLLNRLFHFFPKQISGNSGLYHQFQVIGGSLLVFVLLIFGYFRFTNPVVETYNLSIHKKAGDRKELRVVAFSDLHAGLTVDKQRLGNYVKEINELNPDIILIAGDIIDNNALLVDKEKMYEELNQLNAPLGVYTCLGNHEYISGIKESLNFLKKTNIHVLIDQSICVDNSFTIIGRDDRSNLGRKSLKELVDQVDSSRPVFLLNHQPYDLDESEKNGIDLQISGHTHNGQVWPGNLLVKEMYEVGYGYKQKGHTHVYTSSGIALWGPPFRIGTQSEIVVFNIEFD